MHFLERLLTVGPSLDVERLTKEEIVQFAGHRAVQFDLINAKLIPCYAAGRSI